MPELPEVETLVRDLRPQVVGRRIQGINVAWAGSIAGEPAERFCQRIRGRRIESVGRRGKYLIFGLDDGQQMVVHLRMTGQLLLCDLSANKARHMRLSFRLDDGQELVFCDMRKFGRVYLVGDAGEIVAKLGPEPLSEAFDETAFAERLSRRRGMLKPLLLDQRFIAGLGNIYVDEALFEAGLHPRRQADSLLSGQATKLYRAIRHVLQQGIQNRGTSLSSFCDSQGRAGRNQERLAVFRQQGEPCPRCGTGIERDRVGGRGTFYCPRCQE